VFGHALAGNLHLTFTQAFDLDADVQRYARLMDDLCVLVARKYGGSLKAEHGTGRNVAPFVELEWGAKAYAVMWRIKVCARGRSFTFEPVRALTRRAQELFDPENLLNPGVILNHEPTVHVQNLKSMPLADPLVDKCMECGFCESACPTNDTTCVACARPRPDWWRLGLPIVRARA
jgi:D-lactate dehydrogenase